jgi:iron-sulfur cluster repair protein YtfE (RIC family)
MRTPGSAWVRVVRAHPIEQEVPMDALKLLKDDHDRVKKMLNELDETTERAEKTRTEGLARLKRELTIHEVIEEEIFYPAMKEHAEAKDIVLEAYEEHDVVNIIMSEIEQTPTEDETWKAKFTVMKENLEHHIEEEEGEMFDKAREIFDRDALDELGDRMQARKEQGMAAV